MQIKTVKLFNFGSFVEAEFDMSGQGIVLISGFSEDNNTSNGAGKSTIVEALCWCLFGTTPKGLKGDDVINRLVGKNCAVQVDIEDNEVAYRVIRTRDDDKYKNSLIFSINGKEVLGSDNKSTQEILERHLGLDFLTFTNSVLFPQNSKFKFIQATDAEKKDILTNILNLNWIDTARSLAKDFTAHTIAKIEALASERVSLESAIQQSKESIRGLEQNIEVNAAQRAKQIEAVKTRIVATEDSIKAAQDRAKKRSDVAKIALEDSIKAAQDRAKKRRLQLNNQFASKTTELDNIKVVTISNDLSRIVQLKEKLKVIDELEQKRSELKQQVADDNAAVKSLDREMAVKSKEIEHLTKMSGGNCPTCRQDISAEFTDSCVAVLIEAKSLLAGQQSKHQNDISLLVVEIDKLSQLIDNKTIIQTKLNEIAIEQARAEEQSRNVVSLKKEMLALSQEIATLDLELESEIAYLTQRQSIDDLAAQSDLSKERANLIAMKQTAQTELDKLEGSEDPTELSLKANISKLETRIAETGQLLVTKDKESDKLNIDVSYLQIVDEMFGQGGLKSFVLDNAIYELNNRAEKYLDKLFDGCLSVEFDTLSATKTGKIKQSIGTTVVLNGMSTTLAQLSGGEARRVSLAVDLALSDIIAQRANKALSLLIFDECTENLDSMGQDLFFNLLRDLSIEKDSIFLISHSNDLKNKFDKIIEISKTGGVSRIISG